MSIAEASFYITGGTLRRGAACYVVRQADDDLIAGLRQGKFCYVLTSRQMGLQLELEDELVEFWRGHKEFSPLQRWMRAIRDCVLPRYPGPVVVFVDEIDAVRSLPFSTDEFFAAIREFYNRRTEDEELERLTFCLLGVATPSDLIRDTRTTPFNIGQRIELHDFTEAESISLAQGLNREEKVARALLKRIHHWTNGHPYLTQHLCQAIAETDPRPLTPDPRHIDRLCAELFFSPRAQERDDNLLFVRERMLRSEVDLAGLLHLYEQVQRRKRVRDEETNPMAGILRLSGVARVENGCLRERNRIYARVFDREWIKTNMPDAEMRRQRAAFRRGLLRATAVAGVIIAVMGVLVWFAIQQRNHAIDQEQANRRSLYAAHLNLAQQAWEIADVARVEELLDAHRPHPGAADLRGFEWRYLWALTHRHLFTLHHLDIVFSVAFSPDGKRLATGSSDRTAKLWDVATGRELLTLSGHSDAVYSVAFSPDGKSLASGANDHTVKLWDAASGQELFMLKGHTDGVCSVAFSPDGKRLATASGDQTVRLWDPATGRELFTLKGHSNRVMSLAFSPDGKRLITGGSDRTAKLWDLTTERELFTFKGHSETILSVAFSPDGKRLATGSYDRTARLWNAATGQELFTLKGHSDGVYSVAFSPDGKRLASGGDDHTVKLWDAATGQELFTLKERTSRIFSIAFSPDSASMAAGSLDSTVRVWRAAASKGPGA